MPKYSSIEQTGFARRSSSEFRAPQGWLAHFRHCVHRQPRGFCAHSLQRRRRGHRPAAAAP